MYEIIFSEAKNGSKTCRINGLTMHSSYNPELEAERFANSINIDFNPSKIFIIEPGISYCAEPLKKRFPGIEIFAVRFVDDFSTYDKFFSGVFHFRKENPIDFEEKVYDALGESELCSALFLEWQPSVKIFSSEMKAFSRSVKKIIEKSKTSFLTESYFSKRWFKNSIIFNIRLKKTCRIKSGNEPIVMCASGPSLEGALPFLSKNRERFFLIAASSAISVLLKNGIVPDLALSTDGGFWAKNHLEYDRRYDFPVAITNEAAFPKKLTETSKILPLLYDDGYASFLTKKIFEKLNLPFISAKRNGTVSGTMLFLSLSLTSGKIFACGLDLESAPGNQHAMPNRNEENSAKNENRIHSRESRRSAERFGSNSLEIYRNWFSSVSKNFCERFLRLSDNYKYRHSLGKIKDVDFSYFERYLESLRTKTGRIKIIENPMIDDEKKSVTKKIIRDFISDAEKSAEFEKSIFKAEHIFMEKLKDEDAIKKMEKNIDEKKDVFFSSVVRIIGSGT